MYIHQGKSACLFVPFDCFFLSVRNTVPPRKPVSLSGNYQFEKIFSQKGNIYNIFLKKVTNLTVSLNSNYFQLHDKETSN